MNIASICIISPAQTNTFTVTVASDPVSCRSYLILDYQGMGWNKANQYRSDPVVGYSNGRCQGFMASLTSDAADYLNRCRRLIYRIDQGFSVEAQQLNRGSLAALVQQQQDKGAVFMQQQEGEEKEGGDGIVVQEFSEKNSVSVMEDKLGLALQQANSHEQANRAILQHFQAKN